MKLNRKPLLAALKKCLPGVEMGNSLLEGADTFVFSGRTIHSYNDAVSVSVSLEGVCDDELEGVVSGREFFDLVSQLPADVISMVSNKKGWTLKSGSAKAELASQDSRVPEMIAELKLGNRKWDKLPDNFNEGLRLCFIPGNRSSLSGLAVSEKMMVASDGVRLSWFQLKSKMEQFWITDYAQRQLISLKDATECSIAKDWAHFRCEDGTMFSVKRLLDVDGDGKERFPFKKISKIFTEYKKKDEDPAGAFPEDFSKALNRAGIFSEDEDGFPVVTLEFTPTAAIISSARSAGKFTEKVKWAEKLELEDPVTIRLTFRFLLEALKKSRTFYIKDINPTKRYVGIYADGFIHLVAAVVRSTED